MAFARPTYTELVDRMTSDLNGQLVAAGYKPLFLKRWLLWILVRVYAAVVHSLYGTLEWALRQFFATTAEREYLEIIGSQFGLTLNPAAKATGVLRFTGVDGTTIPSGTEVVREDGAVFITTEGGDIGDSVSSLLDLAAEADLAGTTGNMDDGTDLALSSPISGADTAVNAYGAWSTGTDDEATEDFRDRVLARIREVPQGGAEADYVAWMRAVSGVYRAKALPLARGAGTVDGVFLDTSGTGILGIPTSPQIAAVQAYVDSVRPVTADFVAAAPSTVSVAITVGSIVPNTSDARAAVEAEWNALFRAKALVAGGTTLYISELWAAASQASDVSAIDIDSPTGTTTCEDDEAFILGVVTWP